MSYYNKQEDPRGDVGSYLLGFIMLIGGVYLLLTNIKISSGYYLYNFGGSFQLTTGNILIPFMLGIGMIFYNPKMYLGWIIAFGSLIALVFGVISNTHFSFARMSALDLIIILTLTVGGLGLILRGSFARKN